MFGLLDAVLFISLVLLFEECLQMVDIVKLHMKKFSDSFEMHIAARLLMLYQKQTMDKCISQRRNK